MQRREFLIAGAAVVTAALVSPCDLSMADPSECISLPKPRMEGGKSLMSCLAGRRTNRSLSGEELDIQTFSDILWAAWGINRDDGRHVIPTARNRQQVGVYAVRGDGVWKYLPENHMVQKLIRADRRDRFDGSGLILLYAAPANDMFAGMHVGSMYQNVGLYCAQAGLANCVKYQRHDALDKELSMEDGWKVLITQSVGKSLV